MLCKKLFLYIWAAAFIIVALPTPSIITCDRPYQDANTTVKDIEAIECDDIFQLHEQELQNKRAVIYRYYPNTRYAIIDELFIEETHRGKHHGSQLLQQALNSLKDMGCQTTLLRAIPEGTPEKPFKYLQQRLVNFYTKNGFYFHSSRITSDENTVIMYKNM